MENIKNYFRKTRNCMFAYVEDIARGNELEDKMKRYKKIYKSHRRPSMYNFFKHNSFCNYIVFMVYCFMLFFANLLR